MSEQSPRPSLSYKDAGVDIDAGNALVQRIKGAAARTRRPEVMGGLGGFGALCAIPPGYREPILVSGTDGVRSEEHTSELQSRPHLVCRLLLEKKNKRSTDRPVK